MQEQLICFLGRFQPWHNGHQQILDCALSRASHVLILCGSSNVAPNTRNPWSFIQRSNLIQQCIARKDLKRIVILPVNDMLYNDKKWCGHISQKIQDAKKMLNLPDKYPTNWIGYYKDSSCYYLDILTGSRYIDVPYFENINACDLRLALQNGNLAAVEHKVPAKVYSWLKKQVLIKPMPEAKLMQYFAFVHDSYIMVKKVANICHLPGFEVLDSCDQGQSQNLINGYIYSWYNASDVAKGKNMQFQHAYRSDTGKQIAKVMLLEVKHKIKEPGVVWLNKYQIQKKIFFQDHASIAFNIVINL